MKTKICALALYLCLFTQSLLAASSATDIDPNFQPVTLTPGYYGGDVIAEVALQPNGQILIAGWFSAVNGKPRNNLARLHSNGALDESFVPALAATNFLTSIAVQPDGKILAATDVGRGAVTRLNTDGSLDSSFNFPADSTNWVIPPDIYISPRGETFIAGPPVRSSNQFHTNVLVARMSQTGALTFDIHTYWIRGVMMAENGNILLAFQCDSKPIVAGFFSTHANTHHMARFNLDGTEDFTFHSTDASPSGFPRALIIQPDDKIIYASNMGGTPLLVRFNANGTLDKRFFLPARAEDITSVTLQPDGKILVTVNGDYYRYSAFLRFNADATLDTSFEPAFKGIPLIQPNRQILLAGSFTIRGPNGPTTTRLLRLRGDPIAFNGGGISNSQIQLSWKILDPSLSYTLETSNDLTNWTTLRSIASGATTITHTDSPHDNRFFRLLTE